MDELRARVVAEMAAVMGAFLMNELRSSVVDEIGALSAKLAPFAADVKRLEQLRKAARGWPEADKSKPEAAVAYSGKKFVLTLGPRENERKIRSLAAVFKEVGKTKFVAACSLTLKALTELVGEVKVAARPRARRPDRRCR